ncbi:hypothetical protein DITRI_Ditri15bG0103600 [Diplodiscus trichospermus]
MVLASREEDYASRPYRELVGPCTVDGFRKKVGSVKKSKRKNLNGLCKEKTQSSTTRRSKKTAKVNFEVPFEKQDPTFFNSDFSISDEDIEHRNSIILREAEETWKISSVLGLVFDKDKKELIEVFKNLEEEDRRRKASNV